MTQEELNKILYKHKKWLNDEDGGKRANLRYADLRSADLRSADLRCADLSCADLSYADLRYADLRCADLSYADLSYADLRYADLRSADLRSAINIPYISMTCPDTNGFTGFKKVKFNGVYYIIELYIPTKAKRSSATGRKCRCEYAKVKNIEKLKNGVCVSTDIKTIVNYNYGLQTVYTIGNTVYPDGYDENRFNECSHGIHFFINKQEAINY